jgi:hypothetical protein
VRQQLLVLPLWIIADGRMIDAKGGSLGLGLLASTLISCAVCLAILVAWKPSRSGAASSMKDGL